MLGSLLFLHASGPVLWFHPDLNLSGHSRALPTPLNAQRRDEFYSKALYGTKIREDKVFYVFRLSLVLQLVQQLCTVQLQRSNNNQDIGPAVWLMRYLNSKPFPSCNWKKVTGRFRNCLWRRDSKISFLPLTSLRCLSRSLVRKDRHNFLLWDHFPDLWFCPYEFG